MNRITKINLYQLSTIHVIFNNFCFANNLIFIQWFCNDRCSCLQLSSISHYFDSPHIQSLTLTKVNQLLQLSVVSFKWLICILEAFESNPQVSSQILLNCPMISWVCLGSRFEQHKRQYGISEHGRLPHGLAQSHAGKFKTDACLPSLPLLTLLHKKKNFLQWVACGRITATVNICKVTEGSVYSPRLLNWPESQHDLWPSPEPINSSPPKSDSTGWLEQ